MAAGVPAQAWNLLPAYKKGRDAWAWVAPNLLGIPCQSGDLSARTSRFDDQKSWPCCNRAKIPAAAGAGRFHKKGVGVLNKRIIGGGLFEYMHSDVLKADQPNRCGRRLRDVRWRQMRLEIIIYRVRPAGKGSFHCAGSLSK